MPRSSEYTSLLIADERRAREWELGLSAAGFEARVTETRGMDTEKGDYQVCVAAEDASAARAFMSEVLRGDAALPRVSRVPARAVRALIAVFVTVGVAVALFLLFD